MLNRYLNHVNQYHESIRLIEIQFMKILKENHNKSTIHEDFYIILEYDEY